MFVSEMEEENKKNNYPLSRPILWIVSVCQGKYRQKKKKKERKKKIRIEQKPNWTLLTLCIML